jgi:hypothetical protein
MITNKRPGKIVIDLSGEDGNAYRLLAITRDLCNKTGREWEPVYKEMTSGDYENLLQVMEKYFGDILLMYR